MVEGGSEEERRNWPRVATRRSQTSTLRKSCAAAEGANKLNSSRCFGVFFEVIRSLDDVSLLIYEWFIWKLEM